MKRLQRMLIAMTAAILLVLMPVAAGAQAGAGDADGFGIDGLEAGLVGLFPLVILVSSLLLKPEAADSVKKLLPAVVSLVVAVVYFISDNWPGFGSELVANIGLLITFSMTLFQPVSALSKLVAGGRSLNAITGPGIIGGSTGYVEGD